MLASILLIVNALWNFDSSQWNIKNYTIKDGLNSNRIYSIVQDHRGRYWIASNAGLAYFDGYQFTYLTSENGVKNVDLVYVNYSNKFLITYTLGRIESIKIDKLDFKLSSKVFTYSIYDNFGSYNTLNRYPQFFNDSFILIQGFKFKVSPCKWPYWNQNLGKIESLRTTNPYLNDNNPPRLTLNLYS